MLAFSFDHSTVLELEPQYVLLASPHRIVTCYGPQVYRLALSTRVLRHVQVRILSPKLVTKVYTMPHALAWVTSFMLSSDAPQSNVHSV
jgi:hypothetical protein